MFFLRRTRVGTLSAWGARSARGRARREAEKRAFGRGASLTSQAAPTIAPRAQNLSKSKTSFWLGSQTTSQNISTRSLKNQPLETAPDDEDTRPRCTPTRPRALVSTGRAFPRPPFTPGRYGPSGVSHSAPLLSCLRLGSVLPSVATWALRPYRAGVPRVVRVRRLARRLSVYVLGGRDGDLGARRGHQEEQEHQQHGRRRGRAGGRRAGPPPCGGGA